MQLSGPMYCAALVVCAVLPSFAAEGSSLDSLLNIHVSTASRHWQDLSEAPASISIITHEDIEQYGYRTMDEILATVRGFYTSYDRNYVYIGSRGYSRPTDYNDRILMMWEGRPLNESYYGSASFGTDFPIDLKSIDRIEILRGPASALYGSGAMLAVVNIIPKSGASMEGFAARGEVGSLGRSRLAVNGGTKTASGIDIALSGQVGYTRGGELYFPEYDTDSTNHGIAHNADWDRYFSGSMRITYDDCLLTALYTHRDKGVPTATYGTIFNAGEQTSDIHGLFVAGYSHSLSPSVNISAQGYFNYYSYHGSYPYPPGTPPYPTVAYIFLDSTLANGVGAEVVAQWDFAQSQRLVFGVTALDNYLSDYRVNESPTQSFTNDHPFTIVSEFVQDEFQPTDNLSFTFGLRRDSYSSWGVAYAPRGAVTFDMSPNATLKFLYGEAFRAPNNFELTYGNLGSNYAVNNSLTPERIRTAELVYEHRYSQSFYGAASLFYYRMSDLIDQYEDTTNFQVHYKNQKGVQALGAEVELGWRPNSTTRGYINSSFQESNDVGTNMELTNSPELLIKAGMNYSFSSMFSASTEWQYQSGRNMRDGVRTASFVIGTVRLMITPPDGAGMLDRHFTGALTIRNVLNTSYAIPVGFEVASPAITQDGRSVAFELTVR